MPAHAYMVQYDKIVSVMWIFRSRYLSLEFEVALMPIINQGFMLIFPWAQVYNFELDSSHGINIILALLLDDTQFMVHSCGSDIPRKLRMKHNMFLVGIGMQWHTEDKRMIPEFQIELSQDKRIYEVTHTYIYIYEYFI